MAGSRSGEEAAGMADGSPFPVSEYLAAFARIAVTAKISLDDYFSPVVSFLCRGIAPNMISNTLQDEIGQYLRQVPC